MNRKGKVFNQGILAGLVEESDEGFIFKYDADYLARPDARPICLTMPKQKEPYVSEHLFPFFHGLLAEGITKDLQCRDLKIDENDNFGRLLKTAHGDIIGSVTVEEVMIS